MIDMIKKARSQVSELITKALSEIMQEKGIDISLMPEFNIEVPADSANGDLSTNAAMLCARIFRNAPIKIANEITGKINLDGSYFEKCTAAGAGFINFYYAENWYAETLKSVLDEKQEYGSTDMGKGKKLIVEFVSANPTGPMHIGNARGGAIGDCLSAVLKKAGYEVAKEFYVNDAGNQIEKFGKSLSLRYMQVCSKEGQEIAENTSNIEDFCKEMFNSEKFTMPEDTYLGMDIIEHTKNYFDEFGDVLCGKSEEDRKKALVEYALPKNIAGLKHDLGLYKINYDRWFKESELYSTEAVKDIIEKLKASGYTYEQEGALWFKSSELGDDKDRVLLRANGFPTYLVPDIAYHYNKLVTRGFDTAIDIFGADHHGYIPRIKAAMTALGVDANRLDIVIMQMVRLVRNGETYKLSKRSGKAITLKTLLDEVPIDAARFFFNLREANSQFDFDIDLAISESSSNPVYYVQYAHARICSVLRKLAGEGVEIENFNAEYCGNLSTAEEKQLLKLIASMPEEINESAKNYDPSRMTKYVLDIAAAFHKFYAVCRIKDEPNPIMQSRIWLCQAVKQVIFNVLDMYSISCPEEM